MSRAVTGDHVLFDECVATFRGLDTPQLDSRSNNTVSYLLTSFRIPAAWKFTQCTIHPSQEVRLPGARAAYVSRVENPPWVEGHNPHLYAVALAAVVSFATGRPCRAPRDGYNARAVLSSEQLAEMAIQYPILVAGPGAITTRLSQKALADMLAHLSRVMTLVHASGEKDYLVLMQAMRLLQLSLLHKRDDFGLAYFLVVSSIESVAQRAVKRDEVKEGHVKESEWGQRACQDHTFKELFDIYKEQRGNNKYLKERYVKFILSYAPARSWESFIDHPYHDFAGVIEEMQPSQRTEYITAKRWDEKYPDDLTDEDIKLILGDSYSHRSKFVHAGSQPPHREPWSSSRFFQEQLIWNAAGLTHKLLPNYELICGIARHAIESWASEKANKSLNATSLRSAR